MNHYKNSPSRTISSSEISIARKQIHDFGFAIIRQYVSEEDCKDMASDVEAIFTEREHTGVTSDPPRGIQNVIRQDRTVNSVICYSDRLLELATSGDHLKVLTPFLNDPYYGFVPRDSVNFILAQANVREGSSALPFHVDVRMLALGGRTWSCQCQVALSPRSARSGGLRVRARSHLDDEYPDPLTDYQDAIDIDLGVGDIVLFSSQLHHATHSSVDGEKPGLAFNLTYRCWWAKPQFDFWSMLGRERLVSLTQEQQLILGGCSQVPSDPNASPSLRTGYLPREYFD